MATKKTKKAQESINNRLALVMKSGKYTLGWQLSRKAAVDSCSFELPEAGTYHLDVTVNRMGAVKKVEVRIGRLKESTLTPGTDRG